MADKKIPFRDAARDPDQEGAVGRLFTRRNAKHQNDKRLGGMPWPWQRWLAGAALLFLSALLEASPPQAQEGAARPAKTGKDRAESALDEEIRKINYVFNRGLYEIAIPRYQKLIESHPGHGRLDLVHYPLALCHYHLATQREDAAPGTSALEARNVHLKEAVTHLKEALKAREFESKVEALRLLGQSLLLLEDFQGAAKTFQAIVERFPSAPEAAQARVGLAEAHYFLEEHARAAALFREVLERGAAASGGLKGEDRDRAEYYLAMALFKSPGAGSPERGNTERGNIEESRGLFDGIAARSGGGSRSAYADDAEYMAAVAREKAGDGAGALEGFRRVVDGGSKSYAELGRFGLANAAFRLGKHEDALREAQAFLSEFPASPHRDRATLVLARSLLEMGKTGTGSKMLQDLRTSKAVGDEASLVLARVYTRHAKPRGAILVLSAAIKAFPASPLRGDMELELVSAQLADGKFEEASAALARIEEGGAPQGSAEHAAYLRAYALHRAGKYGEAGKACDQFKEAHPASRYARDIAQLEAENAFLAGDTAGASAAYRDFIERFEKTLDGPGKLKARYRLAQALYLEKDSEAARKELESLRVEKLDAAAADSFRKDPLFASYHYLLGDIAYQLKDFAAARAELKLFLDSLGDPPAGGEAGGGARIEGLADPARDARFKIAHAFQLEGDLASARDAYRSAIHTDPDGPHSEQIQFELGQIAYGEKDYTGAKALFSRLVETKPSSTFAAHSLRFLGWIAFEAGEHEEAAARYRRLADGFPDHPLAAEALYQLALSLQALGQTADARIVLDRFKARHPGDPRLTRVILEEAIALGKEKKPREALALLEKLRSDGPAPDVLPSVLYEIAWCHRSLSDADAAAGVYREILGLGGAGALAGRARLELGELEFDRGNHAAAREVLQPLGDAAGPHREKALYRLVWCAHMLGEAEAVIAAREVFEKAIRQSPLSTELGLLAAQAHLKLGSHEKAGAIFEAVAEAKPPLPESEMALLGHAECLVEARKFERAAARFRAFLDRYPGAEAAYRARFGEAWAAENLGRLEEAMEKYRKVVKETKTPTGARAQFQIGQCLLQKDSFREAIVEFLQVPASFGYPEWASKALLQVAGSFEALEDIPNARKYYSEVASTYPERDEARLAREKLQKLDGS
ncbi:MAG TPA: tetratricopeptide repeat protein [Planctomycetota bacterium]|nr:tetratricopeptide repeat protein [Planctomycetota bacterium]